MQNFSCKNKDSSFLHFLIILPDPYSLFMQLLEKPGFRGISTFLGLYRSANSGLDEFVN